MSNTAVLFAFLLCSVPAAAFVSNSASVKPFSSSSGQLLVCSERATVARCRAPTLMLRASSELDENEDLATKALKAKEEAEKAAQRAAAFKKAANQKEEAQNAALKAAALKKFIATQAEPGKPAEDSSPVKESAATSPSGTETKRRFDRQFFDLELEKPMGLVLEENHESVRGVFVADVIDGSNAAKCGKELVGCQLVSLSDEGEGEEGEFSAMGLELDAIVAAISTAPSPVIVKLFRGSASSLYGGWNEAAKGKEVTVATNLPNKQLIDRIRSGL